MVCPLSPCHHPTIPITIPDCSRLTPAPSYTASGWFALSLPATLPGHSRRPERSHSRIAPSPRLRRTAILPCGPRSPPPCSPSAPPSPASPPGSEACLHCIRYARAPMLRLEETRSCTHRASPSASPPPLHRSSFAPSHRSITSLASPCHHLAPSPRSHHLASHRIASHRIAPITFAPITSFPSPLAPIASFSHHLAPITSPP